jgi:hypothetical protein
VHDVQIALALVRDERGPGSLMVASGVHKRLLERPRPGSARRADASFAGTRVSAATVRTGDGSPQAARIGCSGRRRTVTSRPTLQTDIRNAGDTWVNTDVRVVAGLVAAVSRTTSPRSMRR